MRGLYRVYEPLLLADKAVDTSRCIIEVWHGTKKRGYSQRAGQCKNKRGYGNGNEICQRHYRLIGDSLTVWR